MEWRVSIYGRSLDEWDKLAKWIVDNKLFSHNVRWLIQVPRIYEVYKANGSIRTYEDIVISNAGRSVLFSRADLSILQMCSNLYSRLRKILKVTQSCMCSFSVSSGLIPLMTNPKLNEGFTRSSLTHDCGISHSPHHTRTGA